MGISRTSKFCPFFYFKLSFNFIYVKSNYVGDEMTLSVFTKPSMLINFYLVQCENKLS